MKVTVSFIDAKPSRDFYSEALKCRFRFTKILSSLVGTAKEIPTPHSLQVEISDMLMTSWDLPGAYEPSMITPEMIKVAYQCAVDHIVDCLKQGKALEAELPPLDLTTTNAPEACPYNIPNIPYPEQAEFEVDISDQLNEHDLAETHENIQMLVTRMERALDTGDLPAVLHASASIIETMAKDIVQIPSIQGQTLKGFFDRYRKDSLLPNAVLDYVLDIYDQRSTTPLSAHGSTKPPNIDCRTAVVLCEMTKAFVRIEYRLRNGARNTSASSVEGRVE